VEEEVEEVDELLKDDEEEEDDIFPSKLRLDSKAVVKRIDRPL